ncbi:MAG: hypothetical protein ACRYF5_09330, partial [Janthinobacterium lividum]
LTPSALSPFHTAPASIADAIRRSFANQDGRSPCIIDMDTMEISEQFRSEGASSHTAMYLNDGTHDWRIKSNHHGPRATFHEVFSGQLQAWLFPSSYVPEIKFGSNTSALAKFGYPVTGKYMDVCVASRVLPGFKDWGDFLLYQNIPVGEGKTERWCRALEIVSPGLRENYLGLLKEYDKNRLARNIEAEKILDEKPYLNHLIKNSKTDISVLEPGWVEAFEPLRVLDKKALLLQDRMLALLPGQLSKDLRKALYEAEAIMNDDFENQARANAGPVLWNGVLIGATAVDAGVGGANAFGGRQLNTAPVLKDDATAEELEQFQQECDEYARAIVATMLLPARVDDPYLTATDDHQHYMQGEILDPKRADLAYVSGSFGVIGTMPRSASYAALMKDTISDVNAYGKRPPEMIATAVQLSRVKKSDLQAFVRSIYRQCEESDDANIRSMIEQVKSSGHTEEKLVELYMERFTKLVQRARLTPMEMGPATV